MKPNQRLIAPAKHNRKSWQGILDKKPSKYSYTVAIPHLNTPKMLKTCIQLWQLADPTPYIIVVDTGSENVEILEELRCDNVEIHYINCHAWYHASEPVATAMDLATLLCPTKWLFATHSDCYLKNKTAVQEMIAIAEKEETPVVGYQISPRPAWGGQWEDWVGHTFTLFDRDYLDKHRISWSLRRGLLDSNVKLNDTVDTPVIASKNVIDTEVFINRKIIESGAKPFIYGTEENYKRNVNKDFDHIRSFPSAQAYLPANHILRKKQKKWLLSANDNAAKRIEKWKENMSKM